MGIYSSHQHLTCSNLEDNFLFFENPLDHAIIGIALVATQFVVIHMEAYCNLQPINDIVGHARIIWVDLKYDVHQNFGVLAVLE